MHHDQPTPYHRCSWAGFAMPARKRDQRYVSRAQGIVDEQPLQGTRGAVAAHCAPRPCDHLRPLVPPQCSVPAGTSVFSRTSCHLARAAGSPHPSGTQIPLVCLTSVRFVPAGQHRAGLSGQQTPPRLLVSGLATISLSTAGTLSVTAGRDGKSPQTRTKVVERRRAGGGDDVRLCRATLYTMVRP